jgi:hypothetical protein
MMMRWNTGIMDLAMMGYFLYESKTIIPFFL